MANRSEECAACEDLLAVREWLTDDEERRLAGHLSACPDCRRRAQALTAMAAEFLPHETGGGPDPALTARIMAATAAAPCRPRGAGASLIPALAALVMVLLFLATAVAPGGSALSAALADVLGDLAAILAGLGPDLVGAWDGLADVTTAGATYADLAAIWLLPLLLIGCVAVVLGRRREWLGPRITASRHHGDAP
jgi:anti-sigma factor RsiW